uniref:Retrotransposon gag domain-containing protein n=1 Tax=Populus alba TaxID=43335 RepID=A0A4U5Q829_POPAL|nr:hypothetical protein D5086_0000127890 [Populus alba]
MEQYFSVARIGATEQVDLTVMYLTGDAKLWWRTRTKDDLSAGRPKIETWERLKKELKEQFLPNNTSWIARDELKRLKQDRSVREYVKSFSSLILDIENMSEEDRLFNFMSGLQPWAQAELRRQNVKDLSSAIAAADNLVDYKAPARESYKSASFKSKGKSKEERPKKKFGGFGGGAGKATAAEKGKAKYTHTPGNGTKPNITCFICEGPHFARECPKREKLNAIRAGNSDEEEGMITRVNPMRVLCCLVAESEDAAAENSHVETDLARIETLRKGKPGATDSLMYVKIEINGKGVTAMLDSGATHTFVADRMAKELGLRLSDSQTSMKAVNSKAQKIAGMSYDVPIVLDQWRGKHDLLVITLDDYDLILGLDFLRKAKIALMPYLNGIMIASEGCPCFVPCCNVAVANVAKGKKSLISAIAIEKALRKGGEVFLATIAEEKADYCGEVESDMLDRLRKAATEDAAYKKMVDLVREGTIRRYWLEQDLLYAKGGRIFVPKGELRKYLMTETHDPQWAGHPGRERMVCTGRLVPSTGDALLALTGRVVPPDFDPIVLAFGIGVMINRDSRGHSYFIVRERKLGARRRSDTVLVSTINDADQGLADVASRTPPAPYEKSKFLGSGGSMVARLKLKGIDGRAPPGVEPAA